MPGSRGLLTVVGIGISAPGQATLEAKTHIEAADVVYALIPDPFTAMWVKSLNPRVEFLTSLYAPGKPRRQTYVDIAEHIMAGVRAGSAVCAVTYGHPGVFATPFHAAVAQARREGFFAKMLPGISADACLFADLGVDPGNSGAQSYEATDFLLRGRTIDTTSCLILWQIGVVGELSYKPQREIWSAHGLAVLLERLGTIYPPEHVVTIYEAARYAGIAPMIVQVALRDVAEASISPMSTLYIPPLREALYDVQMQRRLRIEDGTLAPSQPAQFAGPSTTQ